MIQVNSGALDVPRRPIRRRQVVDEGCLEFRQGKGVVVGGGS